MTEPSVRPQTGEEALERLLAGNRRFVEGRKREAGRDTVRRAELAGGQSPFAIILGCADSRVPLELIFDEGLGDLFVVRVAGNTALDPLVVGSIEFAATNLGSVLVMVLGHERCGAVAGAVASVTEGAAAPGSIKDVVAPIVPVVERVVADEPGLSADELLEPSIQANAKAAAEDLANADNLIKGLVQSGDLKIVAAEYLLETGEVVVL